MGWKGYEFNIDIGMVFRKMFCHKCGDKLRKKKTKEVYKKGEIGYSNKILGHTTIGMDKKQITYYIYQCPNCNSEITYDEQCIIAKRQKKLKKKILDENEVNP